MRLSSKSPIISANCRLIALLVGSLTFASPTSIYAESLISQRATHAVQLLDNIRAGALAYYAKNHDWPITSNTPTNLNVLLAQNYVSGLTSYYASASGATTYEPVSAYVDPVSHSLVVLLNVLEDNPQNNVFAARFITDNIVSNSQIVGGNRQIKMVIPPPPVASTATNQLSTIAVPGQPDLNKMQTNLDMQSPKNGPKHDIKNVNNLDSQTIKVGNVNSATNIPANTPHTFAVFGTSVFSDKASFGDGSAIGSVNHTLTNPANVEIHHAAVIDEISAGEIGVDDLTVYNSSVFDENASINFKRNTKTTFEPGAQVDFTGSIVNYSDTTTVSNAATNTNTNTTNFTGPNALLNFNDFSGLHLKENANMYVERNANVHLLPTSNFNMGGVANFQGLTSFTYPAVTNFENMSTTTFKPGSILNLDGTVNYSGSGTTTYGPLSTVVHAGVVNHGGTTTFVNGGQTNFQGDTNLTGADIDISSATNVDIEGKFNFKAMSDTTFEHNARVTFRPGSVVRFDSNVDFHDGITIDDVNDIKIAGGGSFMDEVKRLTANTQDIKAKASALKITFSFGGLQMGKCQYFQPSHSPEDGIYLVEYKVDDFGNKELKKHKLIAVKFEDYGEGYLRSMTEIMDTPNYDKGIATNYSLMLRSNQKLGQPSSQVA